MENYHVLSSSMCNTDLRQALNDNTKFKYLNELRENFTKFENEVWNYDSLCPNEAFKIDLNLPFLLLETFAKLFRLWRDFAAFQKLIKAELFREINGDMNAYFGSDISHFEFYCDSCDKNIAVEGNDLKCSYELHAQDNHHQEVLNHFNYLICQSTQNDINLRNEVDFEKHMYLDEVQCMVNRKHPQEYLVNETCEVTDECHKILQENGSQVVLLNNDCGKFMCKPCDVSGDCWDDLLKHCRTSNHLERQNCSSKTSSGTELDCSNDFIIFNNNRYECLLCELVLNRWEIVEHKREKEHMEKRYGIQDHNESVGGSSSVFNNSAESDGYNDAFKNNDIYIEINLRDDDSEIFKCLLCNKTGKGLDNLDVHCLTPVHQKHKKHIESVSKVYADCDVNDGSVGTINGLDDLFYCRVCDVLIDDEATVNEHMKEKEHIQSELVQKVLDENGACISLLTEEPTRLYHCQLCSRLFDGDSSLVGHGNSNRHTQLLNMVKVLSRNRSIKTIQ